MLTRWTDVERAFTWMDELQRRMNRVFSELETDRWVERDGLPAVGWPDANVYDVGKEIILTAQLPGLSEKDVQITASQDVLTISGERKADAPEGYSVHRQERSPVKSSRSFTFPTRVNLEKTSASMKNGVLTVKLEKAPEAQPRSIAVRAQ